MASQDVHDNLQHVERDNDLLLAHEMYNNVPDDQYYVETSALQGGQISVLERQVG